MGENFNEVFARRLRFYMELYNMKQKDLALKMGVSEASVHIGLLERKSQEQIKSISYVRFFVAIGQTLWRSPTK